MTKQKPRKPVRLDTVRGGAVLIIDPEPAAADNRKQTLYFPEDML